MRADKLRSGSLCRRGKARPYSQPRSNHPATIHRLSEPTRSTDPGDARGGLREAACNRLRTRYFVARCLRTYLSRGFLLCVAERASRRRYRLWWRSMPRSTEHLCSSHSWVMPSCPAARSLRCRRCDPPILRRDCSLAHLSLPESSSPSRSSCPGKGRERSVLDVPAEPVRLRWSLPWRLLSRLP